MAEWLGRFHPLLIHFPIGILVMAAAAVLLLKGKVLKNIVAPSGFFIWLVLYLLACLLHRV